MKNKPKHVSIGCKHAFALYGLNIYAYTMRWTVFLYRFRGVIYKFYCWHLDEFICDNKMFSLSSPLFVCFFKHFFRWVNCIQRTVRHVYSSHCTIFYHLWFFPLYFFSSSYRVYDWAIDGAFDTYKWNKTDWSVISL